MMWLRLSRVSCEFARSPESIGRLLLTGKICRRAQTAGVTLAYPARPAEVELHLAWKTPSCRWFV